MKNVKYPIILEQPTTRVVVEFLLKQFGIRIAENTKVFLCQKETCEVDSQVLIKNQAENVYSEHFICLFSLDKGKGIVPLIPPTEMAEIIAKKNWLEDEITISEVMKECNVQPDFIITYGFLEMPSGLSDMCWCVHEFIRPDGDVFFDGLESVPDVVKAFTDYIWTLFNLSTLSPSSVKKSCKDDIIEENADDVDISKAFEMEDMIIRVLDRVPFETQKRLFKCFCGKKPEFGRHLTELEVWDSKRLRTYMLKYDVLNHFEKYREIIAEEMTLMMPNEGYIEPSDDDE